MHTVKSGLIGHPPDGQMAVKFMLASSSENNVRSVVTFEFYLSTTTINGKCREKKDAPNSLAHNFQS